MEKFIIDLDDLLEGLGEKVKEDTKDLDSLMELAQGLDRNIFIGDIDNIADTVDAVIRFWNNYDNQRNIPIDEREPIKLYIDSYGGSLTEAFTICDSIKLSKTPIWTINIGTAYSGGFLIAICGDRRYAYPHASYLFHEGATGNSADANKFRNFADFYQIQLEQLKDIILKHTSITSEKYKEKQRDDWWITADEAVDLKVCDVITEELI